MALDGARHFGAIHDMSDFVQELEPLTPEQRSERIKEKMLTGGLPTFGHPEIAAAGRGNQVQQDPRPAIYIDPVFNAIDAGAVEYLGAAARAAFDRATDLSDGVREWCVQAGKGRQSAVAADCEY